MSFMIRACVEGVSINSQNPNVEVKKDPKDIGSVLSTNLYASSNAINNAKTSNDDQGIVGTTK